MAERLALIGAGAIGRRHLRALDASSAVELAALVDPDPAAEDLAHSLGVPCYQDAAAMLDEVAPTGVIIATPTEHHLAPTLAALEAGCHVLVEKPITATVDEADRIVAAARAAGREVLVGHQRRYYPRVHRAREILRGGDIGQLVTVSGQWNVRKHNAYFETDWRKRWQAGPVLTNLIHEIDYLRYMVGDVTSVMAETGNPVQGYEKEDVAAFVLRFANGALGSFILSDQADSPWAWEFGTGENAICPPTGQNSIYFAGTEGALEFPNLRLWRSDGDAPSWMSQKTAHDIQTDPADAYIAQLEHFADVIAGRASPRVSAQDGRASLEVTLAVLDSARLGQRVVI